MVGDEGKFKVIREGDGMVIIFIANLIADENYHSAVYSYAVLE